MSEKKISIDKLNFSTHGSSPTPSTDKVRVFVCPTTGGQYELKLSANETIQGLKWLLSRKLKLAPEKISLLHKNKTLKNGTLLDNNISDSSQITLLPNMESGMTFHRADASVIQALENLSDSQINDFLTGRSPLLLAMRVGDHMMFVQLQLSTSQFNGKRSRQTIKSMTSQPQPVTAHPYISASQFTQSSLVEASRNLTQKLHELSHSSKDNETTKTCDGEKSKKSHHSVSNTLLTPSSPTPSSGSSTTPSTSRTSSTSSSSSSSSSDMSSSGAVINSMNHLGRGVFSGTFSGTLDPTLQDQNGKPKRDVSTIVHILNDLLGVNAYQLVHPYIQIRAPSRRSIPKSSNNPVSMKKPASENTGDNLILKEKVQHLQKMMMEKKLKRKARREMKGPYQWNTEQIISTPVSTFNSVNTLTTTQQTSTSASTNCSTEANSMEIADSVDTTTYLNSNLEQESLAV